MSVSIMSCRRNLSQGVFTGYLFKQRNYLPICLVDFQPLSPHTGTLFKLPCCHRNLGAGGEAEKTEKCLLVPDVRDFTRPYSTMRACVEQVLLIRLHASAFHICFLFVAFVI